VKRIEFIYRLFYPWKLLKRARLVNIKDCSVRYVPRASKMFFY